jgi:hypothetical protein
MTTTHAQLMFAINKAENVFSLLLMSTITMLAQLIGAIAQPEQSIMMQLFVMTKILALTNLAILKLDVSSLM